jgi:hypothetical protein
MIALIVNLTCGVTLTAQAEDEQITLDANDAGAAIAAVNELLVRRNILVSSGNADWEI